MIPPPPISTLFPYTTLFRSPFGNILRPKLDAQRHAAHLPVVELEARAHAFALVHRDADFRVHQRSEEHTSELQSLRHLVCRLLLEKKKRPTTHTRYWRQPEM